MMEETEPETIPSLSPTDSDSAFTLEPFLEPIRQFKTDPDPNPNEETPEALADSLGFGSYIEGVRWRSSSSCPRSTHLSWSRGNTLSGLNLSEAKGQTVA